MFDFVVAAELREQVGVVGVDIDAAYQEMHRVVAFDQHEFAGAVLGGWVGERLLGEEAVVVEEVGALCQRVTRI